MTVTAHPLSAARAASTAAFEAARSVLDGRLPDPETLRVIVALGRGTPPSPPPEWPAGAWAVGVLGLVPVPIPDPESVGRTGATLAGGAHLGRHLRRPDPQAAAGLVLAGAQRGDELVDRLLRHGRAAWLGDSPLWDVTLEVRG